MKIFTKMAAKGKVPCCGFSIFCSKVRSSFRWFLNLKMAGKGFALREIFFVSFGKAFFFFGESN